MSSTTAPVTAGGSTRLTTRAPATCTATPTRARTTPETRIAPTTSAEEPPWAPDRRHPADERGAGAQVAGHLPVDDEQEDDRADPAHHQGEVRVQAHDDREDERPAEHGDDVLGAEPDRARPRQPFLGGHRLSDRWGPAVPVELPPERHGASPTRARMTHGRSHRLVSAVVRLRCFP